MLDNQKLPRARHEDLLVEEVANETLIYDLQRHRAHCLNASAELIWKHCDGKTTVGEMKSILEKRYHSEMDDDLIKYTIDKLAKANLLDEKASAMNLSAGLSRRDLVKRIGLSAAILIPAVTSLVAPEAAQAKSCASAGQPCPNGKSDCCPPLNCIGGGGGSPKVCG